VLKTLEGGLRMLINEILTAFSSEPHYKPHADALLPALMPLYTQMSPDTYGGAMLLGVDGICVISHGSSNATAMLNAIHVAHEMVEGGVVDQLRAAIAADS
jgi:phosphate acyltransferase